MTPRDFTAIAVLAISLADEDARKYFKELKDTKEDEEIAQIREAGRAIIVAQAKMVRSYFRELCDAGFTTEQALEITKQFKPNMEFKQ